MTYSEEDGSIENIKTLIGGEDLKKGDDNEIVRLYKEGKSFREIGHIIGISHVAARKRYIKALKVTSVTSTNQTPDKDSLVQVSATSENLGYQSNLEDSGNLIKPYILQKPTVNDVNNSQPSEIINPQPDNVTPSRNKKTDEGSQSACPAALEVNGSAEPFESGQDTIGQKEEVGGDVVNSYQAGNPIEDGVSPPASAEENLKRPKIISDSTKAPVEPKYYKHVPTGQLLYRNQITDETRSECEPYFPPNYLRKTSEPNKGGIYAWTPVLDRRDDFEPYDGPLPMTSKRVGS